MPYCGYLIEPILPEDWREIALAADESGPEEYWIKAAKVLLEAFDHRALYISEALNHVLRSTVYATDCCIRNPDWVEQHKWGLEATRISWEERFSKNALRKSNSLARATSVIASVNTELSILNHFCRAGFSLDAPRASEGPDWLLRRGGAPLQVECKSISKPDWAQDLLDTAVQAVQLLAPPESQWRRWDWRWSWSANSGGWKGPLERQAELAIKTLEELEGEIEEHLEAEVREPTVLGTVNGASVAFFMHEHNECYVSITGGEIQGTLSLHGERHSSAWTLSPPATDARWLAQGVPADGESHFRSKFIEAFSRHGNHDKSPRPQLLRYPSALFISEVRLPWNWAPGLSDLAELLDAADSWLSGQGLKRAFGVYATGPIDFASGIYLNTMGAAAVGTDFIPTPLIRRSS